MEGKVIHSFGDSFNTEFLYIAPPPSSPQYYCGVLNISSTFSQARSTLLKGGGGEEVQVQHFLGIGASPLNIVVGRGGRVQVQHFLIFGSSPLNIVLGCSTFL